MLERLRAVAPMSIWATIPVAAFVAAAFLPVLVSSDSYGYAQNARTLLTPEMSSDYYLIREPGYALLLRATTLLDPTIWLLKPVQGALLGVTLVLTAYALRGWVSKPALVWGSWLTLGSALLLPATVWIGQEILIVVTFALQFALLRRLIDRPTLMSAVWLTVGQVASVYVSVTFKYLLPVMGLLAATAIATQYSADARKWAVVTLSGAMVIMLPWLSLLPWDAWKDGAAQSRVVTSAPNPSSSEMGTGPEKAPTSSSSQPASNSEPSQAPSTPSSSTIESAGPAPAAQPVRRIEDLVTPSSLVTELMQDPAAWIASRLDYLVGLTHPNPFGTGWDMNPRVATAPAYSLEFRGSELLLAAEAVSLDGVQCGYSETGDFGLVIGRADTSASIPLTSACAIEGPRQLVGPVASLGLRLLGAGFWCLLGVFIVWLWRNRAGALLLTLPLAWIALHVVAAQVFDRYMAPVVPVQLVLLSLVVSRMMERWWPKTNTAQAETST